MKHRAAQARKSVKRSQKAKMAKMTQARLEAMKAATASAPLSSPLPSTSTAECSSVVSHPPETTVVKNAPLSASRRKLQFFTDSQECVQQRLPTTICELDCLSALLDIVVCKQCKQPGLFLKEGNGTKGFSINLQLWCPNCELNSETYTSSRGSSQFHEVNRKVVASCVGIGIGHPSLNRFCEGMGMRGMDVKTFKDHHDSIFDSSHLLKEKYLQESREIVKQHYKESHPEEVSSDGVIDIAVSYDGTWQKRGHKSKLGCSAVIELDTGLVIDYHVMSMQCQSCTQSGKTDLQDEHHKTSGKCTQNYCGTSGGMEVEAALVLWKRSVDQGFRYTTLLGDGDTKTFLALTKAKPYGEVEIKKEECVNHVAKRLGTGLRNLKTSLAKKGERIGGKAKGSLTDSKIALLQSYFTSAVRSCNSSTEEMRKAIIAGLNHSASTNDEPQHDCCPDGESSWCWFKKEIARGVSRPVRPDGHQSTYLSKGVAEKVKEVYDRLTDEKLLGRCLLGKTQNPNESLHSLMWSRCPKHLWAGFRRVHIALTLAVGEFNMGSLAFRLFLSTSGCTVHETAAVLGKRRDAKRIRNADEEEESVRKKIREAHRLASSRLQQEMEAREGGPSYSAGQFI